MSPAANHNMGTPLTIPASSICDSFTACPTPPTVVVYPGDATTADQMNIVEVSGALSFWDDPEEDRYGHDDGKPI